MLRQGSRYEPPAEPRLLRALQQQVDYLGLTAPSVSHQLPDTGIYYNMTFRSGLPVL